MDDPEAFLGSLAGKRVALDEIHRLSNPAELLKVAADHYPEVRVLATGSSVLGATARFRDTLAGRKRQIWLTPMVLEDTDALGPASLEHRLHRGGLPPFFLAPSFPEADFQEWMDAYWARDIQELFRLERRQSFQRLVELILANSGGMFDATRFARQCEISRTTVANYLGVLQATFVAHVVRPYSSHRESEIVKAPKVYGFDTGFVAYYRGWYDLRPEDLGSLWEHFVLNELHASLQNRDIRYWRDKQGHEVDFVLVRPGGRLVAVECQWSARELEIGNLKVFRRRYPGEDNFIVAHDIARPLARRFGDLTVNVVNLKDLVSRVTAL
jgi:predicted AAA+ superfamily ATPase